MKTHSDFIRLKTYTFLFFISFHASGPLLNVNHWAFNKVCRLKSYIPHNFLYNGIIFPQSDCLMAPWAILSY